MYVCLHASTDGDTEISTCYSGYSVGVNSRLCTCSNTLMMNISIHHVRHKSLSPTLNSRPNPPTQTLNPELSQKTEFVNPEDSAPFKPRFLRKSPDSEDARNTAERLKKYGFKDLCDRVCQDG